MQIYLVGGAVRDILLGRSASDKDWVVVGSNTNAMLALGFRQVGKDFPVFLHPQTQEEYALARIERKIGAGYYGFSTQTDKVSLEDDLRRRDLSINAMAQDTEGQIIDPFGGMQDIKAGLLRHVSDAFVEDPIRILRTARFLARFKRLGFRVAEETLTLMRQMVRDGQLEEVVPERFWQELVRALQEPEPEAFITCLYEIGALQSLWPELHQLWGVAEPLKWHPEGDTGAHTLLTLGAASRLSDKAEVRFAALCHDVGKGLTPIEQRPRHIGHEYAGLKPIKSFCTKFRVPNYFKELALLVCHYHMKCNQALCLRPATLLKLLMALDAYQHNNRFEDFLIAVEADARGRAVSEPEVYRVGHYMRGAREITLHVPTQEFIARGLKGKAIGEAIYAERIARLKNYKQQFLLELASKTESFGQAPGVLRS